MCFTTSLKFTRPPFPRAETLRAERRPHAEAVPAANLADVSWMGCLPGPAKEFSDGSIKTRFPAGTNFSSGNGR